MQNLDFSLCEKILSSKFSSKLNRLLKSSLLGYFYILSISFFFSLIVIHFIESFLLLKKFHWWRRFKNWEEKKSLELNLQNILNLPSISPQPFASTHRAKKPRKKKKREEKLWVRMKNPLNRWEMVCNFAITFKLQCCQIYIKIFQSIVWFLY